MSRIQKASAPEVTDINKGALDYMTIIIRGKNDPVWWIETVLEQPLWDAQRNMVRNFYRNKYDPTKKPYKKAVLAWGQRSGKTALMACIGLYEMFDICTLENPAEHYGLLKNQLIMIPVLAPSEEQVMRGVFGNMVQYVENNKFLKEWMGWQVSKYSIFSPTKNVKIEPYGSWANTGRGSTAKAVIFDEMDYFEDTTNRRGGHEVYAAMSKATATLGNDAHIFVISSLKSTTSKVSQMLAEAAIELERYGEDNTMTYAERKVTWEINPHLTKEALMKEFEFDLATFWRDYGCMPQMWNALQFPEGVKLKVMRNLLAEFPLRPPEISRHRVMAIDPAYKNDAFGVAIGYKNDNITIIDGVTRFRRKDGDVIIRPSFVKDYIRQAIKLYGVHTLVYDALMSADIIEMCVYDIGIHVEQHNVSKKDYDLVRSLMSQDRLQIAHDTELKLEMEQLVVKNETKVDHPLTGSKDAADCVANVTWALNDKDLFDPIPQFLMARGF